MSDYLTVQEVADLARCEHKSVRRAIAAGQLEAFRGPKRLVIREDHARAWIEGTPAVGAKPSRQRSRSPRAADRTSVASLKDYARREGRL